MDGGLRNRDSSLGLHPRRTGMGVTQRGIDLLSRSINGEYKDVPLGTSPSSHPVPHLVSFTRPVEALGMQGGKQ